MDRVRLVVFALLFAFSSAFAKSKSPTYKISIVKRSVKVNKSSKGFIYYKVKPGETLYRILRRFHVPLRYMGRILKINHLKAPKYLRAGQVIKLPQSYGMEGVSSSSELKLYSSTDYANFLRKLGIKVVSHGIILLNSGEVNLSSTPLFKISDEKYLLDLKKILSNAQINELKGLGYGVVRKPSGVSPAVQDFLLVHYGAFDTNGTIEVGNRDRLTYHYDFAVYDPATGQVKVFNLKPDTPKTLRALLGSYGVLVYQPPAKSEGEKLGELKIVVGSPLEKIGSIVSVLTGEKAFLSGGVVFFKKSKIAIASQSANAAVVSRLKLKGYRIIDFSGNLKGDLINVISQIPLMIQKIRLVIVEPPGSKGKRSKFEIPGYIVQTPKENWFLLDYVERLEEIPYMRSRGVNIVFY